MNSKMRKWVAVAGALTTVFAIGVAGAQAADAKPGPVVATWKLAPGFYQLHADANAMWAANVDEVHDGQLYRIDPSTRRLSLVRTLPFPVGGMDTGFGSIWISDYFGNSVWRLAPDGHVQAVIPTGLQPQWLHAAFGSMWVSNHHGASMTRIDGTTNAVLDTVQVGAPSTFRNGPQAITDDGTKLYVGDSNLQALQAVDPSTDAVSTPGSIDDAFCGPLAASGGFVWSPDSCTGAFYQLGADGSVQQVIPSTGMPGGVTTLGTELWISDDQTFDPDTFEGSDAVLDQLDPSSGAVLRTVAIGGDAADVASGFGDLWVFDGNNTTVRRVHV